MEESWDMFSSKKEEEGFLMVVFDSRVEEGFSMVF